MADKDTKEPTKPIETPQETTVINTAAPATAQSNANLLLILILFVILLIGVALAFTLKGNADDEAAKKRDLRDKIAALRGGDDNLIANGASLEARISSIVDNANKIRTDHDVMRAGYTSAKQQLKSLKAEQDGNLNTITRLSNINAKVQEENDRLKALASNAKSYQEQSALLSKRNLELEQMVATLKNGPTVESVKLLEDTLSEERLNLNELRTELTSLRRQMTGMVDSSRLSELDSLRLKNGELAKQLAALRSKLDFSRLFVKAVDQLPIEAQEVFNELKTLENNSATELAAAYANIGVSHNAENMQQVKFETGSAQMDFKQQSVLKNKMLTSEATDYFLVVGYASTSGDAASNETLSANRATSVASLVNQLKKAGQDVRAVYLGQTSRFSKSNHKENQLCEIWRIKK